MWGVGGNCHRMFRKGDPIQQYDQAPELSLARGQAHLKFSALGAQFSIYERFTWKSQNTLRKIKKLKPKQCINNQAAVNSMENRVMVAKNYMCLTIFFRI